VTLRAGAVLIVIAAAPPALAGGASDDEALAIMRKHCVTCHAVSPTHESFREAPKNITLETLADLKKYASTIYAQTVQTKAMPLGNQTGMTDDERAALGLWLKGLP
jgi:uncharacterized membrane protein